MSSTRGEVVGYIGGKVEVKEERNIQKNNNDNSKTTFFENVEHYFFCVDLFHMVSPYQLR